MYDIGTLSIGNAFIIIITIISSPKACHRSCFAKSLSELAKAYHKVCLTG